MTTKIIVSYDGSENDRDALALGRLLGTAGAPIELAYVRHALEAETGRERFAESEADELLGGWSGGWASPSIPTPRRDERVDLGGSARAGGARATPT